jgi:adenylosuccinate synthase
MPVSIVVGGQYGSEGKGKVAHYLARELNASFAVRCGGPNSGHTVIDEQGNARIFQQLPTASILPNVKLAICSGSYIDLSILIREIEETNARPDRLFIDKDAVIITDNLKTRELENGLIARIGSTGSGTGAAVAARTNREKDLLFAKDISELKPFINDVPQILREALDHQERIIIEGTQGFGLSPLHSRLYPYTTSRDTTAAAFLGETGLSPLDVDDVVLTIRSFPIRVSGNSGPLDNEIDWQTITNENHLLKNIEERTSVTKHIRRVARFDSGIVIKAVTINRPTKIVLNHIDYISHKYQNEFIKNIEKLIYRRIDFIGDSSKRVIPKSNFTSINLAQKSQLPTYERPYV